MNKRLIKKRKPLASQLVEILRDSILHGEFKPGERLNESVLSSRLGVSRSPIREALKVLEREDLVLNRGQRGTFVKNLSVKEIMDIYAVASAMQSLTVRFTVERMDEKKEKQLRSLMQRQDKILKGGGIKKSVAAGREFHRFIVEAAGNDLLTKIHDFVRIHEERCRLLIATQPGWAQEGVMKEHIAISEAMFKRDADEAEALIKEHFERSCKRALNALANTAGNSSAKECRTSKAIV